MSPGDLLHSPFDDLVAEAGRRRDGAFGDRVTFSPKVFIPLTMLCRDRCGYCTFAKPPARLASPFLDLDEVVAIAAAGAEAGCREALFTLGEAPEDRYEVAQRWLEDHGYGSTVDYLVAAAGAVLEKTGLLPHANAGALTGPELERLRAVSPSQGMMLETLAARLGEPGGAHHRAPDKTPQRRLATLEAAGAARIPFTTGLLVGIGETREERLETLEAIAASHARHGHVQEVIVQNFLPKPGTGMAGHPPCPEEEMLWTVAAARLVLPTGIHLQAPPNLASDLGSLVAAGIDDWGGVSPVTPDHVNPERPWPELERLRQATEAAGKVLAPRLTVYPEYVTRPDEWLHPDVRFAVMCASDSEGLARPGGTGVSPGITVVAVGEQLVTAAPATLEGGDHGEHVGIDHCLDPALARLGHVVELQRDPAQGAHVDLADGGQSVALVLLGVALGTDPKEAQVEEAHGAGQHPVPVQIVAAGQGRAAGRPQRGKAPGEIEHVIELLAVPPLTPGGAVEVLAPPGGVGPHRLQVPVGPGADPHVTPGRGDGQVPDPLDRVPGETVAAVVEEGEAAPAALPGVPGS